MARMLGWVRRIARAIGGEIAATIMFGAIPAAAAPHGQPAQTDPLAAVVGMGVIGTHEDRPPRD